MTLTAEQMDDIEETIFYNKSFNISMEETLKYFELNKDDIEYIQDIFKINKKIN